MTNMARKRSSLSEEQMTKIFEAADVDSDGYISFKEARRAYKKVCKWLQKEDEEVSFCVFWKP